MASSEGQDVVAEPPRKRQRISPQPSTAASTQLEPVKVAKMEDTIKQTVVSDTGFQPDREKEVGILHFVNEENRGFTGTLKQRYVICDPFLGLVDCFFDVHITLNGFRTP